MICLFLRRFRILLDSSSAEGRARKNFISSFDTLVKSSKSAAAESSVENEPLDMTTDPLLERVRRFMDSIQQHVLVHRREQLTSVLQDMVRSSIFCA
jgi:hypothetical protein